MTEKQFKKDEVIFREGTVGDCMYDITEGTVGIYVNYGESGEQKLTELKSGQFFGEMAVIEAYNRSATAVALDDVKAYEISAGDVSEYFDSQPDRIIAIMKHLSSRIHALTDDYTEVSAAIAEFGKNESHSDSLIDKIKKFANTYKHSKNNARLESAESLRKSTEGSHSEGYKNKIESYKKGTIIFKENESGNCLYDIHGGSVALYKAYGTPNEKLIAELGENKFFGEMSLIDSDKRLDTAVAIGEDTTIEIITLDDLKELFNKNKPKVMMILSHLSYRLRSLTKSYMDACKMADELSTAEEAGSITDDIRKKADSYQPKFYE